MRLNQLSSILLIVIFDFNLFRKKNHVLNIKMALVSSTIVCMLQATRSLLQFYYRIFSAHHTQPSSTESMRKQWNSPPSVERCIWIIPNSVVWSEFKMTKMNFYQCPHIKNSRWQWMALDVRCTYMCRLWILEHFMLSHLCPKWYNIVAMTMCAVSVSFFDSIVPVARLVRTITFVLFHCIRCISA